jgi:hypothetical protein
MRSDHLRVVSGLALIASLGLCAPAFGQAGGTTATLRGTIVDSTGAALRGVLVTLTSVPTGTAQATTTTDDGSFSFIGLFPSTYDLTADRSGFKTHRQTAIRLSAGDARGLDVRMEIGSRAETVAVTSYADILQTETGARQGRLTAPLIDTLPSLGRSALELLRILPGVVAPDPNQLELVTFGGGANNTQGYTVNGIRSSNNTVSLDGASLLNIGPNAGLMLTLNNDMAQEVTVQSSNFAAEYGSGGMAITAVTRSGTSTFHGSMYDYNRNYHLAANDRSNALAGIAKPQSLFNYPGGNIGGPIAFGDPYTRSHDRLFFFAGLEVQRQRVDLGAQFGVVPTDKQREGDLSEFAGVGGSYLGQDRTSILIPQGFPGAGTPAPGGNISPYLTSVGRALVSLYPTPNYHDENGRYNYVLSDLQPTNRLDMKARIDWNITSRTKGYVRVARETERIEAARGGLPGIGDVALPSAGLSTNSGRSISSNVVTILSPSTTNEMLASWSQLRLDSGYVDPSKMELATYDISLPGPFGHASPFIPGLISNWSGTSVGNLWSAVDDSYGHNDELTFSDKLTRVAGAHALKFGASVQRLQEQGRPDNFEEMALLFDPSWTAGGTKNVVGDILTGRITQLTAGSPAPNGKFRMWNSDLYAQDSWKLRPNLTLEYGVRLGYWSNNRELNGLGAVFEPSRYDPNEGRFLDPGTFKQLNGFCYVNTGCAPPGMFANRSPFAMPRLNAAWDINGAGRNVIRGGYGLFYNRNMGNVEYSPTISMPPGAYTINEDVSTGAGLGNGLGLTYATLPEASLGAENGNSFPMYTLVPESFKFPRTHSFSASYARRIFFDQVVEAAYVGTRGRDLVSQVNINVVPQGALLHGTVGDSDLSDPVQRAALDASVVNSFRPYPAYGAIRGSEFEGASDYNSLQLTLSRQSSRRLQYFAAYTLSRTTGTLFGEYGLTDPFEKARTYGVLPEDRRHILNVSWNATLPDGARGALSMALLRGLLNGWQLSGISTAISGTPILLSFSGDASAPATSQAFLGTPDAVGAGGMTSGPGNVLSPVFACDPRLAGSRVGDKVLDVGCVTLPAFGTNGPIVPPYDLRAPWRITHDLTLFKNFALRGAQKLQFRAGAFNLFNTAWADPVNGDIDLTLDTRCNRRVDHVPDGTGGDVDGVCDPAAGYSFTDDTNQNFGRIVLKRGHRAIELVLKYYF